MYLNSNTTAAWKGEEGEGLCEGVVRIIINSPTRLTRGFDCVVPTKVRLRGVEEGFVKQFDRFIVFYLQTVYYSMAGDY